MKTLTTSLLGALFAFSTAHADVSSQRFDEMAMGKIQPGMLTIETTNSGYQLNNGLQTLSAKVTSQGVAFDSVGNSAGKGGLSLQFSGWGRAGNMQPVISSSIYRNGEAVYHVYANGVVEKFSNASGGIQQDFIVANRLEGQGSLRLQLHVDGATASEKGDGAVLALKSGRQLTYDRLSVTDSKGQMIPAHIEVGQDNSIAVVIDDAMAVYPLAIDPTVGDVNWVSMGALNGTDGQINAMVNIGGYLYVAGGFSNVGNLVGVNNIARWDGTSWSTLGTGLDLPVSAMVADSSGNIYVGGSFANAGGVPANYVAEWNGSSWSALGSVGVGGGVDGNVLALAADSSGNVYVGGQFANADGSPAAYVAKWSGSAWSALGSGTALQVRALAVDASNNLYVGGDFTTVNGTAVTANRIAKWNGTTWSSVGTGSANGTGGSVYAIAVTGSTVYVGGSFTTAGGVAASRVAKWSGTAWTTFKPGTSSDGVNGIVRTLAIDSSSNVFVGGSFTASNSGTSSKYAIKWTGTAWTTLGVGVNATVYAFAPSAANMYVAGSFTIAGNSTGADHVVLNNGSNGWTPLGSAGPDNIVKAAVFDANGNLYIGGDFVSLAKKSTAHVAKWDGTNWSALGTGMSVAGSTVYALAVDSSNNLYAGGSFTTAGGVTVNNIAKWNGTAWSALGTGMGGTSPAVQSLVVTSSGLLYAGGNFTTAGGVSAGSNGGNIAVWNGTSWAALGAGTDAAVVALAADSSNNVYLGGSMTIADVVAVNNIAMWNGSSFTALDTGTNSDVYSLLVDSSSNLYAGGLFTNAGGTAASHVAKWNGSTWSALGSGLNSTVNALAMDNVGLLYVGGQMTTAGGSAASYIARWNGSSWSALGSGANSGINALAYTNKLGGTQTGVLVAGGSFLTVGTGTISPNLSLWAVSDVNGNGTGDYVDADIDGDGVPNALDAAPYDNTVYCASGQYWGGSVCVSASPGYYVPDQHSTSQTACSAGTYQSSAGQNSCITDTTCSLGVSYESVAPTLSSDRVCTTYTAVANCATYSPVADACTSCLSGYALTGGECALSSPLTHVVQNDFDGDGKSDVLFFNTTTGGDFYWSAAVKANAVYPGLYDNVNYVYAGAGDFNGDGKADILFTRASNNGTLIWDGAIKSTSHYPGVSASGFVVAAICDVTGDKIDDIVWFNPATGGTQIWPSAVKANVTYPGTQATAYHVAACADFDGDGKADLFWRNDTTGGDEIWLGALKTSTTYPGANTDLTWSVVGAGDTNGDGFSDVVWYRSVNGGIQVWPGANKAMATYPGAIDSIAFVPAAIGDYDGDGKADLLWSNPAIPSIRIWPGLVKPSVIYPGTYSSGYSVEK